MNIYVASKYENKAEVRDLMARLVEAGHDITHDWTADEIEANGMCPEAAVADFEGVAEADLLVFVVRPGCKGAWVEMGVALATGAGVLMVTDEPHTCIFEHMDGVFHVRRVDDVVPFLSQITAGGSCGDFDGRN